MIGMLTEKISLEYITFKIWIDFNTKKLPLQYVPKSYFKESARIVGHNIWTERDNIRKLKYGVLSF